MNKEEVIRKISKLYRDALAEEVILKSSIDELTADIKKRASTISHKEFLEIDRQIKEKEQELYDLIEYSCGIFDTREIFLNEDGGK